MIAIAHRAIAWQNRMRKCPQCARKFDQSDVHTMYLTT